MYQIITDIKPASDEFDEGAIIQSARDGSEIIKADITEIEAALLRAFRECDNDTQFRAIARLMNDRDASQEKAAKVTAEALAESRAKRRGFFDSFIERRAAMIGR